MFGWFEIVVCCSIPAPSRTEPDCLHGPSEAPFIWRQRTPSRQARAASPHPQSRQYLGEEVGCKVRCAALAWPDAGGDSADPQTSHRPETSTAPRSPDNRNSHAVRAHVAGQASVYETQGLLFRGRPGDGWTHFLHVGRNVHQP